MDRLRQATHSCIFAGGREAENDLRRALRLLTACVSDGELVSGPGS